MRSRKDDATIGMMWKIAELLANALRAAGFKPAGIFLAQNQYADTSFEAGRPDEWVVQFRVSVRNGTSHILVAEDGMFRVLSSADDRPDSRVLTRQVRNVLQNFRNFRDS